MAINDRLLKISGVDIGNIADYSVEYNKWWKNADRNLAGVVRATLIGIFPKIKVKLTIQNRAEAAKVGRLINAPFFDVSYYDPLEGRVVTAKYYASDFTMTLLERERELFHEMTFNLIPMQRKG